MGKKAQPSRNGAGEGPLKTLQAVYEFMTRHGLDAVELIEDGARVKLVRRNAASAPTAICAPAAGYAQAPASAPAQAPAAAMPQPAPAAAQIPAGTPIKSPMMGIFYRAPSPSSPPFCKEGDQIKPGQVLCMIEAMKVFNEIKAEYPCTIAKCLVENGKPVKLGQDLIIIQRQP